MDIYEFTLQQELYREQSELPDQFSFDLVDFGTKKLFISKKFFELIENYIGPDSNIHMSCDARGLLIYAGLKDKTSDAYASFAKLFPFTASRHEVNYIDIAYAFAIEAKKILYTELKKAIEKLGADHGN